MADLMRPEFVRSFPPGIVYQFVTKNQVVCPARTPWASSPGTGYLQRSPGQSLRFTGSLPAAAPCWGRVGAAALRRARPSLRRAGGQLQRPG